MFVLLLCIRLKYPVLWRLSQMVFTFQWKWLVVIWSLSLCLNDWTWLGKQISFSVNKCYLQATDSCLGR